MEETISFENLKEIIKTNLKKESPAQTIEFFLKELLKLPLTTLQKHEVLKLIATKTKIPLTTLKSTLKEIEIELHQKTQQFSHKPDEKSIETDTMIEKEATELLYNPAFLAEINKALEYEITGDEANRICLVILSEARKYSTQLIGVRGIPSAGKNAEIKIIPKLFDNVYVFASTTSAYFYRKVLQNKIQTQGSIIIHLEDRSGIQGIQFEQLYGEEEIVIGINVPKGKNWEPIEIRLRGPLVYITTSTENPSLHRAAREWTINPDESMEQTKRISLWRKWKAKLSITQQNLYERKLKVIKHAINKLKAYPYILIPYLDFLNFPSNSIDDRRKEENFITLIKLIAHFYQYQRPRNEEKGILVSLPSDFYIACRIASKILALSRGGLNKREEDMLEMIKKLKPGCRDEKGNVNGGPWFFLNDCVERSEWKYKYDLTFKTFNSLVKKGFLSKIKVGKNNLYKLLEEKNSGETWNPTLNSELTREKFCFVLKQMLEDDLETYEKIVSQVPEDIYSYTDPFLYRFLYEYKDGFVFQYIENQKNSLISGKEQKNIGIQDNPTLSNSNLMYHLTDPYLKFYNQILEEVKKKGVNERTFKAKIGVGEKEEICVEHKILTRLRLFDFFKQTWKPACISCVKKAVEELIKEYGNEIEKNR
ncbi:MAG: hypothetical protein QXI09_00170 [Candidatus Aenigmatarchaeota archaeon]